MPGRAVLSTVLLLWLAQPTLQGGTGYQPQNGGFGQMLMPFKGYGIGTQNANAYQPNTKAQGYGPAAPQPNGNGAKGYGAAQTAGNSGKPNGPYKGYGALPAGAPLRNGNGAKPNGPYKGYGAVPSALGNGNGAKPNGLYKGYGAAPASLVNGAKANGYGNGGKHNGYRPAPVATKGLGHKPYGYGASPLTSNGQQAKPISNGGYGSKPNKPGYGAQPLYGGFGAAMRMAPPMATKGRGGYGKGNGFGQADSSNNGYRNKPAAHPQAGAGFGGGYTKGVKAAKPGYGGKPFVPSGQAAKPNAFVPGAGGPNAQGAKPAGYGGATGAKAGYSRFPNNGGFKGPKPGYGGLPTGYGQRLNGYGGYPNGGAKAPKPGYGGVGNGEASNGQGAKPNGFGGYPNGGVKAPKPGYGDGVGVGNGQANNGQGAKSNGYGVPGGVPKIQTGYGSGPWYPNSEGAKASKPGQGYGPKPQQPDYVNPGAGFGFAGLGGMTKGKSGGPGQLPYSGAPIIPARLDGASPVEPQTAELGPEVKSGHAYGGPYGAQPMGMGAEGMPQVRYGIGGLLFGGSPTGYGSNPYGKYGNAYAAQPFGSKAAGNYNPFGFNADPKSAPKYRMEGSPYAASASVAKASGKYGPYGGQQFGVPVNYGKYGNPSLPFEALGPVTDGQSVDQPALPYEVPVIDGVKSVDQFGDGEVPHQPIAPLVDGVGEGPVSHIKGGVQAEAVPTGSPFTGSAASLGNSAHPPVDTPSEAVTPQHLLIQQNLKGPQLHQANSWTGDEKPKHNLKGFFGNGYHG